MSYFRSDRWFSNVHVFGDSARHNSMPPTPEGTITGNVRFWMKEYGISQKELARRICVSPPQVSKWLNAPDSTLSWGTICRLSNAIHHADASPKKGLGKIWPWLLCVPIQCEDNCRSFSIIRLIRKWILGSTALKFGMLRPIDMLVNAPEKAFGRTTPDADTTIRFVTTPRAILLGQESRNRLP